MTISQADRDVLLAYLARHNTLTLATVDEQGHPHAAALFYAFDQALRLIFLSDPQTAHVRHLASSPRVAVTIQADGQDWRSIMGLQMHGVVRAGGDEEARIYLARFPFILQTDTLRQALSQVRFYRMDPTWIRLIDNRQGFAHKQEWTLS